MNDEVYHCVGICLPDEDEAYCIGCGRPWCDDCRVRKDDARAGNSGENLATGGVSTSPEG